LVGKYSFTLKHEPDVWFAVEDTNSVDVVFLQSVIPHEDLGLAGCGKNVLSQQFLGWFESFGSFGVFRVSEA
jgi:hypothetical protein